MRVLFVNHSSAPDHLGGSERSLFRLIDEWLERNPALEPQFVTKAPKGLVVAELEQRGWPYRMVPFTGWAVPPHDAHPDQVAYFAQRNNAATLEIAELIDDFQPDLVVTNTVVAPWGAFAAAICGVPHAWMVREYGDLDHGLVYTQGREATLTDIGVLSVAVFANSEAVRDHLAPFIPTEKLSIVYPVVDRDALDRASTEFAPDIPAAPPRTLLVTVVGRLAPSKGQWRVIDALGVLADRDIRPMVIFVGALMQPEYDAELVARAKALGVDRQVRFVGEQANPFPYVAAADVCITPSGMEAFGRTTLEYLTLGKPVIAMNAGGSAELIVDDETGFLVDTDDIDALADRLAHYSAHRDDIARHGERARQRAHDLVSGPYSNRAAIERLESLVGMTIPRLPNAARGWLSAPIAVGKRRRPIGVTVKYLGRVVVIRARNFAKDPVGSARRNIAALRTRHE
ncbi:glycosyltransferase family 4 protein [Microcella sp.]|uniref:glycosyltransferase family 4 protein n=1 Tax=Microcella sp. TaxID=1913979 RepID=UPI00391DC3B0